MPNLSNEELERLYSEAESVDKSLFAEQRSNILLVAGEHYTRSQKEIVANRIRDSRTITKEQKLRLTKNHMAKIIGHYQNNILNSAPGVTIFPDNDKEIQDQKTAELNKSVWEDAKHTYKLRSKIRKWCKDYCEIGEVAVKLFWDPTKGQFMGYEAMVNEMGEPVLEPTGEVDQVGMPVMAQVPDESKPVFSGEFIFERIFGFNLMRAPEAKDMDESPYLIVRKMVNTKELKNRYRHDPEKLKNIQEGEDETYLVFDGTRGSYNKSSDQTLVQEFYFRANTEYPNGYFVMKVKGGILEEGELPFGIFPIVYQGFDEIQTSARHRAKIKQLRPYQIEINRCASAMATHQVTIGDDKLVVNTGAKVESGALLPGVRTIKVAGGGNVTVLPGRSGEQYLGYMNDQIKEMYDVADLAELLQEKPQNQDPYVLMFQSLKQKKKFALYIEKFEEFLVEVCELYLKLARIYLPEDALIQAIGKREYVNIAEFKNMEPLGYRVRVEPQVEDLATQMGKQLTLNHALQFVGNSLDREDIGKMMRAMPFANMEEAFSKFTMDEDNLKNDILALERGEFVQPRPYDNHEYIIKGLVHRMKSADFVTLHPQVQEMFNQKLQMHEQIEAEQQLQIQMAQAGFIPTGGALVKADVYINTKDGKQQRAILPYEALMWLIKRLEQQNMGQESLESMQQGAVADIAQMMGQQQGAVLPNM